jgi:hypothetical protein
MIQAMCGVGISTRDNQMPCTWYTADEDTAGEAGGRRIDQLLPYTDRDDTSHVRGFARRMHTRCLGKEEEEDVDADGEDDAILLADLLPPRNIRIRSREPEGKESRCPYMVITAL